LGFLPSCFWVLIMKVWFLHLFTLLSWLVCDVYLFAIEKSKHSRFFLGPPWEPEVCWGFEQDARPAGRWGGCHGMLRGMEHGMLELSYWGRSSRLIWARKNGDESAAECAGYQHRTTHGIDYWLERGIQACWCLRYARCAEIYEDALPSIGKLSLSWVRSQSAGAIFRMMFVGDFFRRARVSTWLEAYFFTRTEASERWFS
jgi:hypothetical protein